MAPEKIAVLLLAHGSPDSVDDIPEFLLRITSGRPLRPQVIEEVKHRYSLIGHSPLTELTMKQGELLAQELGLPVYVGMRNWKPFIADTVSAMIADGIQRAVVICLAPQESRTSVGLYRSSLLTHSQAPFTIDFVESWHDHPLLIEAFAERLQAAMARIRREIKAEVPVIFTAHSVPQRTIDEGDPYERHAQETAALVAGAASLAAEGWVVAFQSQGASGGAWLGPTVEETMLVFKAKERNDILIQPIGFLCDHVEILYDIDIAFQELARKEGMRLWRPESLNDSEFLIAALADIVRKRLAQSPATAKVGT